MTVRRAGGPERGLGRQVFGRFYRRGILIPGVFVLATVATVVGARATTHAPAAQVAVTRSASLQPSMAGGAKHSAPFNHRTANPVLVVGNQFDPATDYHGAVTVANLLPNSALLTLHAWGHTSLFLSSCADEVIARYLIDGQTPLPGTVCEQDEVPFSQ